MVDFCWTFILHVCERIENMENRMKRNGMREVMVVLERRNKDGTRVWKQMSLIRLEDDVVGEKGECNRMH